MNNTLLIITIINTVLILVLIIKTLIKSFFKKESNSVHIISVNPEEKKSDMHMIYEALDYFILKELHNFTLKDFSFTSDSTKDYVYKNHYRDLIKALLSPNQYVKFNFSDENIPEQQFFNIFINKIYLNYISETSENIKSLLFKYYSGYTKDEYFLNKKEKSKPSALPFIINYVRNYLWCRYEENEDAEQQILETIRSGSKVLGASTYEVALENYDKACCRKLTLNIYHANDIVEVSEESSHKKYEYGVQNVPKTISDFGLKQSKEQIQLSDKKEE